MKKVEISDEFCIEYCATGVEGAASKQFLMRNSSERLLFFVSALSKTRVFYKNKVEENCIGVSPSGKAAVFGTAIRRFESFHPN